MHEAVHNIKVIRLPAAAVGVVVGVGFSYFATHFIEQTYHSFPLMLIILLLPIIVIGVIALILWTRNPLSDSDALLQEFVGYFGISFFLLYYATYILLMLAKVG